MKKFTKYQLVGHKDYIHYNPLTHKMAEIEINSFTQDGKVYLYFIDDNIFQPPDYLRDPIDPEQLLSSNEVDKFLPELEKAFQEVERELKIKLEQASNLIQEANNLGKAKLGVDIGNIGMLYAIESAMYDAGWNNSSQLVNKN